MQPSCFVSYYAYSSPVSLNALSSKLNLTAHKPRQKHARIDYRTGKD